MIIGIDFDNTIVCYDDAIKILAEELFSVPSEVPKTKMGIREYLKNKYGESEWTAFQGKLYGPGIKHAKLFEHSKEILQKLQNAGHTVAIISHRSKNPYSGDLYDMHKAAREWIREKLSSENGYLVSSENIHFLETKREKITKIRQLKCQIFIDDLPEILKDPQFPKKTKKILFSQSINVSEMRELSKNTVQIRAWDELQKILDL